MHQSETDTCQLLESRRRLFARNLSLTYETPFAPVRGERHFLFDRAGTRYLDAYNNVPHVGHCHPRVVHAVCAQLNRLNVNSRYLTEAPIQLAEMLCVRLPAALNKVFFLNSASEANEIALRLARAATNARGVIVMEHGYHGCTTGATDISHYKFSHPQIGGAPDWVRVASQPDLYRGAHCAVPDEAAELHIADVENAISDLANSGVGVAGFISECLPSVGGQIILPAGYLQHVYSLIRAAGGICIADDVQTALGRLGEVFWGFEQQDVVPDIVVLGKPLGNGYPLAAVITTEAIAEAFANGPEFFSTFGGSTASCAAGSAVLDVVEEDDLQANARDIGDRLLAGFEALKKRHDTIGDVRGMGLFWGLELVTSRTGKTPATASAKRVKDELYASKILIGTDGPDDNVLKIRPPMTFDRSAADELIERLDECFSRLR